MADPTPTPDLTALSSGLQEVQYAIGNLLKQMGIAGASVRTTIRDIGSLTGSLSGLSAEAKTAVTLAAEKLKESYDAAEAMKVLTKELTSTAITSKKLEEQEKDRKDAMMKMDEALKRMRSDFDISSTSIGELRKRLMGGTLDLSQFSNQLLNTAGSFKYGFTSAILELAKGAEHMDINIRKATVGMMGLGEGRVRGAQGLGMPGGEVGLRQYQATPELREAAKNAIGSMILMGKGADQATAEIMSMTQVFGGAGRMINGVFHSVSMEAMLVATAFAKAANVSEQTSRAATIQLTQRLGMSTQQAATTLNSFAKEAKDAGMGTELYTSWVTELSQATINYTKDIHFSQAVVRKFAEELKSGVLTVQQFAQMTGAMRGADFGRQAGIMALAQQWNVKIPGAPPGMSPLASIGFIGEKNTQNAVLAAQVGVMRAMAARIAPQGIGGTEEQRLKGFGALRLAMGEEPALKPLLSLNNDILDGILKKMGGTNLDDLQKKIAAEAPADPADQMDNLITTAENINLSTQTLADAIQATILGNAFRVFPVRIGPNEEKQMENMNKQREFEQKQRKDMADVRMMERWAHGTAEQKEKSKQFFAERTERLQAQQKEQEKRQQVLTKDLGLPDTESHRLAALESLGKQGDPMAQKQAENEIKKLYDEKEARQEFVPLSKMAKGGSGIVTKPTIFLAGEEGPESFDFRNPLAPTPRPQLAESRATAPQRTATQTAPSGSNVNVDVKVGLTGDDKEGLIRRTIEEVEKALRKAHVFGLP